MVLDPHKPKLSAYQRMLPYQKVRERYVIDKTRQDWRGNYFGKMITAPVVPGELAEFIYLAAPSSRPKLTYAIKRARARRLGQLELLTV